MTDDHKGKLSPAEFSIEAAPKKSKWVNPTIDVVQRNKYLNEKALQKALLRPLPGSSPALTRKHGALIFEMVMILGPKARMPQKELWKELTTVPGFETLNDETFLKSKRRPDGTIRLCKLDEISDLGWIHRFRRANYDGDGHAKKCVGLTQGARDRYHQWITDTAVSRLEAVRRGLTVENVSSKVMNEEIDRRVEIFRARYAVSDEDLQRAHIEDND